jgi:hypothetical protein
MNLCLLSDRLSIMPDFEQVCRRLFSDPTWILKCLVGTVLMAVPVLHFAAFGYFARAMRSGAAGEVFVLPDWDEWRILFVQGFFFFVIFLGLSAGLFLLAFLLSLPFQGWLGLVAYVPFIPAFLLAGPLSAAGWYRFDRTGRLGEAFRLPELFRLLRLAGPRIALPTLAFLGLVFAAFPVFPLAFFIGGTLVFFFYAGAFSEVENGRRAPTENAFSVL